MMNKPMSKGEMENQLSRALTQWEKEYLGRGSVLVKADIVRNMIIVLLKGILTPAEQNLAKTQEGLLSIKKIRADLVESGLDQLGEIIEHTTNEKMMSFHTDISTRTGERIMVFMMEENLEKKLQG
ncbi:DUF2294 domain-containing protein [Ammoniphilus sp. CFH 90114]|uniref:DUF2294 domain-containing protein n=1 Tax=Ammoniphilus sp. CFH 90114 TaxID=2493665 RepID=UPI00100DCABD|nr:DUF2294 domain-containing protein [Ammoniphilus sp. CFH 90114]RXT15289.1 DUF2294 domain-containing protein [Ammoniphilus sp. CFH 90114]